MKNMSLDEKKLENIESCSKVNNTPKNKMIMLTWNTRKIENQQRESKEDKPLPPSAAILKNGEKNRKHMKTKMKNQRVDEK